MSENKIFAGPRVRRIRNGLALTQTAMAEALAISPSYLNLIERNQRPLTVQLLLKLASVYKVDLTTCKARVPVPPGNCARSSPIRSWWARCRRRRS